MSPRLPAILVLALAIAAPAMAAPPAPLSAREIALLDRVTWGADAAGAATMARMGPGPWLARQLHPSPSDALPREAQAQIDAMTISRVPVATLVVDLAAQGKAANEIVDPKQKNAARAAYQQAMTQLAREAAAREILRDLYSPDQLEEQMTWFWFNHFNVHAQKANVRVMVGDYEESAIRPHALGHFRDLLEATLRHPAMLRYLDNADNAAGHINENYAREIMELHTMGVGSGYSQKDVQELARILTGVGIDANPGPPRVGAQRAGDLIRAGLFEFNPNRHDYGDKVFLGHVIKGRGFGEVEQALDILAREPATAAHISRELAIYFVADDPPASLVGRMAKAFQHSHGDIAQVLAVMFASPEFSASLGGRFKDPVHYAISAVRLAYDGEPIANTTPIQNWINRLAEGLYNHETPDGYPMIQAAWDGPGQMATRFEIARQIGSGVPALFTATPAAPGAPVQTAAATVGDRPAFPQLQKVVYSNGLADTLAKPTLAALGNAASPREWNTLFLASPEFMRR
jgi:uncharacterized protein (DUF1800 family)